MLHKFIAVVRMLAIGAGVLFVVGYFAFLLLIARTAGMP